MKSFFRYLSSRFPFLVRRPSALERAVRQSPKSRRLGMEPLENRALLAVDAFGGAASLLDSGVGESWGPAPAPAAFSASVLATDAAIVDVSGVNATHAAASFSVQAETPEPVAPPSFEQLMEALGQVKIESLDDESDAASTSCLDAAIAENASTSDVVVRRVVFEGSDVDSESLDEPTVVVPLASGDGANAYNGARSGGESGNSGGEEDLKPFLSGGYGKAGYADFVFSADDVSVQAYDVSGWFTNPAYFSSSMTYSVVDENLDFLDASFTSASTLQISLVDDKIGKGSFTMRATNTFGNCDVTINVYSGRVVGYALEEKVWGGDWGGVEDSESGENGWNLLWRENEYRWTPIFDGGVAPDAAQVRTVAVGVKTGENETTGEDIVTDFGSEDYELQYDSGGSDATAENIPNPWPCVVGIPSGYGEKEIAMTVTLSGADINDNSKYCVAKSTATLKQNNDDPETAVNRPRVAVTEVQSVTWEAPEVIDSRTDEMIVNAIRLSDDPHDSENALRCFPEEIILEKDESENDEENNENEAPSPLPTQPVNQINAKVTLASSIPVGMVGTVSLNWFDPRNLYGSLQKLTVSKAAGPRDNNGTANLSTTQLTFTASTPLNSNVATLTVTQANAGDNYIVAAHPNVAGLANYEFADAYSTNNDVTKYSSTITYTDPITDAREALSGRLQTPQLTVWRTLWVEYDQMYYYETYGDNDDSNDETLIAPALVLNDIAQNAFAEACVDVVEYPQDVESRLFSGYGTLDYPLNNSQTASLYNARQSNLARETHWTVQAISAFRLWISREGQPNESKLGFTSDYYVNTALF